MSKRKPTSIWVPIDTVVPHPLNANMMSDEQRAKLDASIGTWEFAPCIVRSLEMSEDFKAEHAAGKLQCLDGEHRWRREIDRGASEIEVRVWKGVPDTRAVLLLKTLNPLRGEHDKKKDAELLRILHAASPDPAELAKILPETEDQIRRIIAELDRGDVQDATTRARAITMRTPLMVYCGPGQVEIIRRALREQMRRMDAAHQTVDCEDGEALSMICQAYLDSLEG